MVFFSQICFNSRMISSLCSAGGPNYSIDFKLKISKKKKKKLGGQRLGVFSKKQNYSINFKQKKKKKKKKKKLVGLWLGDFGIIERSRIANHKIIENCLVQARKLLYF